MVTEKVSATLTTVAPSHVGALPADNQQDKKSGAALLAHIGVYAEEAEKFTNQSKGNGLGAEAPSSTPPSDPSDSDAGQSDSSDSSEPALPPLLALLMAGITIESQTNGLMTSLGTMSSAMTAASTNAAAALAANLKLFYEHGEADGSIAAQTITKTSSSINLKIIKNPDGTYEYQYSTDNKTWVDAGPATITNGQPSAPKLPAGYDVTSNTIGGIQIEAAAEKAGLAPGGESFSVTCDKESTTWEAGGIADTTDATTRSEIMAHYQTMQNDANTTNTQFGTLCALAGTGQQQLTQSVNTAEGDQSSTIQVVSSLASMINGWAGV